MRLQTRLLPWLSAGVVIAACGAANSASKNAPVSSGGGDVIAMVDGQPLPRSAMDEAIAKSSFQVRQQYYDLQRQILDQMIIDRLIEKEAKEKGKTKEALIKAEVDDKVKAVTDADIHTLYESQKAQMGGRTEEMMKPQIQQYLAGQRQQDQRAAFEAELRRKGKVQVKLDPPRQNVEVPEGWPSVGPENAPITIVEFTDYQCPYCQRAQNTLDEIMAQYGTKIRVIPRDFPLDFHNRAMAASRAVHCAGDQKKHWDYHVEMLRRPGDFSDTDLEQRASTLGLDAASFKTCLASTKHDEKIRASQKAGESVEVRGTPAFFINGRFVNGAPSKSVFAQIIDDELSRIASN
jgi:protein-disulfide isomerase